MAATTTTNQCLDKITLVNDFADTFQEKLFYHRVSASPLPNAYIVAWNKRLAKEILDLQNFDPFHTDEEKQQVVEYFGGNKLLTNSKPIACVYSGFQFGYLSCPLGDGRALLLGQVQKESTITGMYDSQLWDVQLKGCGRTPYSRFGDGLAVLRSTVREYLCSEAMHALGIPTTRALCIVASDQKLAKREKMESAAMMTRIAQTHIRFGSFEVFYYYKMYDQVKQLAEYTRKTYNMGQDLVQMFEMVVTRTAQLIAKWQSVGFCHGVLNTDNMSILGLTIDYGPFAFMNSYNPNYICNHSDDEGRYMYKKQPEIGYWNCEKLGQVWTILIGKEQVDKILATYHTTYEQHYMELMRSKMGLQTSQQSDTALLNEILQLLEARSVDYTNFWRHLSEFNAQQLRAKFAPTEDSFDLWAAKYAARLQMEQDCTPEQRQANMNRVNPKFILRTHMAQEAIDQAQLKNFAPIEKLYNLLQLPFDEQQGMDEFAKDAPAWSNLICLSCSS